MWLSGALCLGLGGQLCKVVGLAFCDVGFALCKGLLGLVPSLLGDLLIALLDIGWISTDGSMSLLVEGFNLLKKFNVNHRVQSK